MAEQLHRACLETGFFYVRNHGAPKETIAEPCSKNTSKRGFDSSGVPTAGIAASECTDVLEKARRWFSLPVRPLPAPASLTELSRQAPGELGTVPQDSAKQEIALTPDSHYRGFQRLGDNVTRYDGGFARASPVCKPCMHEPSSQGTICVRSHAGAGLA